jgi:hypothetical protein
VAGIESFGAQQLGARAFFYDDFNIAQTITKPLRETVHNSDDFSSNFLVSQREAVCTK